MANDELIRGRGTGLHRHFSTDFNWLPRKGTQKGGYFISVERDTREISYRVHNNVLMNFHRGGGGGGGGGAGRALLFS